jgi:hypothetical protein
MMMGGTGGAMASLFQRISRLVQAFANCSFGSLCTVFNGLPGGCCTMLDCLTGFLRSFLNRLTSFLDRSLIVRPQCERYAQ